MVRVWSDLKDKPYGSWLKIAGVDYSHLRFFVLALNCACNADSPVLYLLVAN